jgi:alpha-galactosidase
LQGLYDTFAALVGMDANGATNSAAEFVVVGDGKELWRSGTLAKTDNPKPVEVGITGVQKLVLRVTGSGERRTRALADWAEPKVARRADPPKK